MTSTYIIRNEEIKKNAISEIQGLYGEWEIKIGKPVKSAAQRNYFHKLCEILGDHFGKTKGYIKMEIKYSVLDLEKVSLVKDGVKKTYLCPPTTEDLTKDQYSQLIESCFIMAASDGVKLPLASFYGLGE